MLKPCLNQPQKRRLPEFSKPGESMSALQASHQPPSDYESITLLF